MRYAEGIEPLSSLETRSVELLRKARETGEPVLLTEAGKPAAVLQDAVSYQRQRDALMLLKLAVQGERDYRQGAVLDHKEADAHFREKLAGLELRD